MPPRPRVPIVRILYPSAGVGRNIELIRGICDAYHERYRWQLDLAAHFVLDDFLTYHREHPADGLIVLPTRGFRGGPLHDLGLPTLSLLIADGPLPVVKPDDEAVGRLAAEHLVRPGWGTAAVYDIDAPWWEERLRGWRSLATDSPAVRWPGNDAAVVDWLRGLPDRTAIFAANDNVSLRLARLAPRAGRTVGTDLRLIGVDDEIDCHMTSPALSSIRLPLQALARLAVSTMGAMLAGRPVPACQTLPPRGLVVRGSTDPMSSAEPWLRDLAEELRMTVASGRRPDVTRLLARDGRHRATVNRAWRAATGMSVMASIQQYRRELAQERLAAGSGDLDQIARSLGLTSVRSLQRILS